MSSKDAATALLAAARDFPSGDDIVWDRRRIIWKEPETWAPALTAWLDPFFRADAMRRLKPGVFRDLSWDDQKWLEILGGCARRNSDDLASNLADAMLSAFIRTYHGCRTEDAGTYFREGLLVRNRARLKARVTAIVEAHEQLHYLKPQLDRALSKLNNNFDNGKAYVALSDEALLKDSAHYLIHGSEWIMSVFDSCGREVLRRLGVPTMIEIDLPASMTHRSDREQFASKILMEWTRIACNGYKWSAPIDFSFALIRDVPSQYVVKHSHPAVMIDPHNGMEVYRSPATECKHCIEMRRQISSSAG